MASFLISDSCKTINQQFKKDDIGFAIDFITNSIITYGKPNKTLMTEARCILNNPHNRRGDMIIKLKSKMEQRRQMIVA